MPRGGARSRLAASGPHRAPGSRAAARAAAGKSSRRAGPGHEEGPDCRHVPERLWLRNAARRRGVMRGALATATQCQPCVLPAAPAQTAPRAQTTAPRNLRRRWARLSRAGGQRGPRGGAGRGRAGGEERVPRGRTVLKTPDRPSVSWRSEEKRGQERGGALKAEPSRDVAAL